MTNQDYEAMIVRYFSGQLTEEEYVFLKDWLADDANLPIFEHARTEWEKNPPINPLVESNLRRLNFRLNRLPDARSIRLTEYWWFRAAAVAALLLVGLLLGNLIPINRSVNNSPSEILVFETPRGQKSMVKLPDGSEVWLNAKSKLTYTSFSPQKRQVELSGEAFFKVAHKDQWPFIVKTNACEVEVLGTTFNVMAYDEFGRQEITLLNGKVMVHLENANQEIKPGQSMILKDHQGRIAEVTSTDASGWVENKFNFRNIPLSELMKRLENWYDVDITLENRSGREVSFTGTFKNEETIWQVLDAISVYTPITYTKTNLRKITITVKTGR